MNIEIKIREANEADLSTLALLNGELGYETTLAQVGSRLASISEDPSHMVFVAADPEDNVLGWIHVYSTLRLVSDPSIELGGFVISSRFRNQGIGKLLLSKAEEWAKDHKAKLSVIRTRSTRTEAHHFYEKSGYEFWKDHKVYRKSL